MSWVTRTKIGRQALFELSKENDFTINLKGSEWENPQFFISIKSIKYPKVLKSIKFKVEKLSILNGYKIRSIVKGIDLSDEKVINKDYIETTECYGYESTWFGSGYKYDAAVLYTELNKYRYENGSYQYIGEVPAVYVDDAGWDPVYYVFYGYEDTGYMPTKYKYKLQQYDVKTFYLREYIDVEYEDDDIILTVLIVESSSNLTKIKNSLSLLNEAWINLSKIYFKSTTYLIPKVKEYNLELKKLSKNISWNNPNLIYGATSLYRRNNNDNYNIVVNKIGDATYKISNVSKGNGETIIFKDDIGIVKFSRTGSNYNTPYTIKNSKLQRLYILTTVQYLEIDGWYFNASIYCNGLHLADISNDSNNLVATMYAGGSYHNRYYIYRIDVDSSYLKQDNTISATFTYIHSRALYIRTSINGGTKYISLNNAVDTYNDTLIYAFESDEEV